MSTTSRARMKSQSVIAKCQVEIVDLKVMVLFGTVDLEALVFSELAHAVIGLEVETAGLLGTTIRELGPDGSIPFPDGFFDLVTNNQVMEHVEDLDAVLAEIARVLDLHPRKVSYLWIAATEKLADALAGLGAQ